VWRKDYCLFPKIAVLIRPGQASFTRVKGSRGRKTKTGGTPKRTARSVFLRSGLEGLDVGGLEALGSLGDFKFNRLAIIERLIAISHNCGEMDENVLTALALDEPEALAGIEPLHCSLFFTHCFTLFCQPFCG
jgi:hypothetical protein